MTCKWKGHGYDKGMDKDISKKGRLWIGKNIVFPMTWLGSQATTKVRLSMRA